MTQQALQNRHARFSKGFWPKGRGIAARGVSGNANSWVLGLHFPGTGEGGRSSQESARSSQARRRGGATARPTLSSRRVPPLHTAGKVPSAMRPKRAPATARTLGISHLAMARAVLILGVTRAVRPSGVFYLLRSSSLMWRSNTSFSRCSCAWPPRPRLRRVSSPVRSAAACPPPIGCRCRASRYGVVGCAPGRAHGDDRHQRHLFASGSAAGPVSGQVRHGQHVVGRTPRRGAAWQRGRGRSGARAGPGQGSRGSARRDAGAGDLARRRHMRVDRDRDAADRPHAVPRRRAGPGRDRQHAEQHAGHDLGGVCLRQPVPDERRGHQRQRPRHAEQPLHRGRDPGSPGADAPASPPSTAGSAAASST